MTDLESLMYAVLCEPWNDLTRLMLADELDDRAGDMECGACLGTGTLMPPSTAERFGTRTVERGERLSRCGACSGTGRVPNGYAARAEFIRVQVELAKLEEQLDHEIHNTGMCSPYCRDCPRRDALRRRERELLDASAHVWLFDLPPGFRPILPDAIAHTFTRGFVSELRTDTATFIRHAEAVFRAQPVTSVVLVDREPQQYDGFESRVYGWINRRSGESFNISAELFDKLVCTDMRHGSWRDYPTRDAALDALSAACVAWGRERAGLPKLEADPAPAGTGHGDER